jgi:hypothetical protein
MSQETPHRRHHDMGGQPAGPVDRKEHEIEPWEKRIEAILRLLYHRDDPIITVDELRRGIEELPPKLYDGLSYYERWIASMTNLLVEKGVLTRAEIEARLAASGGGSGR